MAKARGPFRPSAQQRRFADATEKLGYNESVVARCRLAEVKEKSVRKWLRDDAFSEWLRAGYWRSMADQVTTVWASIVGKAKAGSMRACHMFLTRFDPDYVPSDRQAKLKDRRARKEAVARLLDLAREHDIPCETGKEV